MSKYVRNSNYKKKKMLIRLAFLACSGVLGLVIVMYVAITQIDCEKRLPTPQQCRRCKKLEDEECSALRKAKLQATANESLRIADADADAFAAKAKTKTNHEDDEEELPVIVKKYSDGVYRIRRICKLLGTSEDAAAAAAAAAAKVEEEERKAKEESEHPHPHHHGVPDQDPDPDQDNQALANLIEQSSFGPPGPKHAKTSYREHRGFFPVAASVID
jgi:hypothetical protein